MASRRYLPLHLALLVVLSLSAVSCSSSKNGSIAESYPPNIVAVYLDQTLTIDQFEVEYARAVGGREEALKDSLPELEDFLNRYVDFRLKVVEARQAGYDKDSTILSELSTYRASFARPYLMDKNILDPLVQTVYERSSQIVDVSHILKAAREDALPADTLRAYNAIVAVRDSIMNGSDFGLMAYKESDDQSARSEGAPSGFLGRLGNWGAGNLVEPFETYMYTTPVGEVSPVFRTKFGYHVLKVHNRQPTVQDVRVSHIMTQPQGNTSADSAAAKAKLAELKTKIDAGESFRLLASQESDHVSSRGSGGDLGFLQYTNYQVDPAFREAAFSLELNEVTDVVESAFGYHLITITERREPKSFEEQREELKAKVSKMPRAKDAERILANDLIAQYGLAVDTTALVEALSFTQPDSVLIKLRQDEYPTSLNAVAPLTIGDSTFELSHMVSFAKANQVRRMLTYEDQADELINGWWVDAAISYEATMLEKRDAEFARIMKEFSDGLLLFRLMEDSVWAKAAQDSMALAAYYEANNERYTFPGRTRILEFYSRTDSILQDVTGRLDAGTRVNTLIEEIAQDSLSQIEVDTIRVEGATQSVYDRALSIAEGQHSEMVSYRNGRVLLYRDEQEAPRKKTFDEARSEVLSDYQLEVEAALVARLRQKYDAHVFPERLLSAFTVLPAPSATSAQ